jgi:hypothetical protein
MYRPSIGLSGDGVRVLAAWACSVGCQIYPKCLIAKLHL